MVSSWNYLKLFELFWQILRSSMRSLKYKLFLSNGLRRSVDKFWHIRSRLEKKEEADMWKMRYPKRVSGVLQFSRILAPSALTPMGVRELGCLAAPKYRAACAYILQWSLSLRCGPLSSPLPSPLPQLWRIHRVPTSAGHSDPIPAVIAFQLQRVIATYLSGSLRPNLAGHCGLT